MAIIETTKLKIKFEQISQDKLGLGGENANQ